MFIRYRSNHAWGSSYWDYVYLPDYGDPDSAIEEFVQEVHNEYEYSDKYRGCDVEKIEPSTDLLEKLIFDEKKDIEKSERRIKFYEQFLPDSKREPKKECSKCSNYYELGDKLKIERCKAGHYPLKNEDVEKLKNTHITCPDMTIKEENNSNE